MSTGNPTSDECATQAGVNLNQYNFTEQMIYQGNGTLDDSSNSTDTTQETVTDSWGLSEQGTFANGSVAVTSYVFQEQQTSNVNTQYSGGWNEAFSGANLRRRGCHRDFSSIIISALTAFQAAVGSSMLQP